ncbi:MAG TPA: transglutaminaseTgpA domain-containing protein [Gaiellaceae bacterium]|nr:transglutaminaseTgpA domain-containing protein [Gaiellaceae bacterium]
MRSAARTVAVAIPALAVVTAAWLRLEQPLSPFWRVLALLGLAIAAALPRHRWLRCAAVAAATVAAARIAVGVVLVPWRLDDPGSAFGLSHAFSTLGARFGTGFDDFYGTHLPFDPHVHAAMTELVLSAVFVFALGIVLLAAARRPVATALALLLGAGWPATLLGPSHGVAMGAAILGALLVVLAGLGSRRVPALALPAAAVVALAAVAVGSATAARHGLVHWQTWNLAHVATGPDDIGFVWNAQYGGLKWSGHPITVLQVQSDRPPSYLRAAVLDDFKGNDAWGVGPPRPSDALEPPAALSPRNQTREIVTVNALADSHLVGGSIPIRYDAPGGVQLVRGPGLAALNQNLPHGFRYTVWSYTARPSKAALRRSPAEYPLELVDEGLLDVGGGQTWPAFGTPHRAGRMLAVMARSPGLRRYLPLARLAEQVAGGARTPYGAVSRLEYWFVSSGIFRYSNHPTHTSPPLVGFVAKTHAGYCQYFAGAMALMLRYLGVPARVAVGFAGGTYDSNQHLWNVTDREAHAWVEVWFKGYGWVPFDPTPSAPGAAPRLAQAGADAGLPGGGPAQTPHQSKGGASSDTSPVEKKLTDNNGAGSGPHARGSAGTPDESLGGGGGGGDRSRPALLLLAVLAGAVAAIVLTKIAFRMTRSVRRDPRGVAAACRQELTAFLVDQRIEAPRSATFGDLGELLHREFGVRPEVFVASATAARFGPPEAAAAGARTARKELQALLEAARRGLTARERLRGLLSLRSLTRPAAPADAS